MKKLMASALAAAMVLSLAGCGSTASSGATSSTGTSDTAATSESAAADGVATLTEVTGTVPAQTPVLINAAATTYDLAISAEAGEPVSGNLLSGTLIATAVPAETRAYILVNDATDGVGFYLMNDDDRTIGANKAYLTLPASVDATSLSLKSDDGTITGINGVEVSAGADAPVYDLQGRRLPQVPEKGIYIQNGKKIMK